jgi:8-oxo-dGTP pyrophosphatase MutT (NUDIX family)
MTEHATDPLGRALAGYRPETEAEAADLRLLAALVAAGDPWRRDTTLHATASALILHVPSGRVLLRWHRRQQAWLQVGGHADPSEVDPLAVAMREGMEETGLTDLVPWPDASIRHVVVVPVPAAPHEAAHEHIDVRYLLATADPGAAQPENAASPLRWLAVREAIVEVAEPNLRETLGRADRLLATGEP